MKTKEQIEDRIKEYKSYKNDKNLTIETRELYSMLIDELKWTIL